MPGKAHRGKKLWGIPSHGRGTCPICKSTRIKLLYELTGENGKLTVCKKCRNRSAS